MGTCDRVLLDFFLTSSPSTTPSDVTRYVLFYGHTPGVLTFATHGVRICSSASFLPPVSSASPRLLSRSLSSCLPSRPRARRRPPRARALAQAVPGRAARAAGAPARRRAARPGAPCGRASRLRSVPPVGRPAGLGRAPSARGLAAAGGPVPPRRVSLFALAGSASPRRGLLGASGGCARSRVLVPPLAASCCGLCPCRGRSPARLRFLSPPGCRVALGLCLARGLPAALWPWSALRRAGSSVCCFFAAPSRAVCGRPRRARPVRPARWLCPTCPSPAACRLSRRRAPSSAPCLASLRARVPVVTAHSRAPARFALPRASRPLVLSRAAPSGSALPSRVGIGEIQEHFLMTVAGGFTLGRVLTKC